MTSDDRSYARRIVVDWPPLSEEQRSNIRFLLSLVTGRSGEEIDTSELDRTNEQLRKAIGKVDRS